MREHLNCGFVLLLLGVQHGSVTAVIEPRGCAEGICLIVQGLCACSVWKSSSSSRTQLLSKAALIYFPPISSVYFCILPLLNLFDFSLSAGGAVLPWPFLSASTVGVLATVLQWDCPFSSFTQSCDIIFS